MTESAIDRITTAGGREFVGNLVAQEARKAFDRQGFMAFAMPFHDAAVHEASHAVIHTVQGTKVLSLEIFEYSKFRRRRELEKDLKKSGLSRHSDKVQSNIREILKLPAWGGWCTPEHTAKEVANPNKQYRPCDDPQHAERQVRFMIAGLMGELLLGNTPGASSLDESVTAQMTCADAFGMENGAREWTRITGEVLTTLRHFWPVVLTVADLLEHAPSQGHVQHRLEGPTLAAALERVDRGFTATKTGPAVRNLDL